MGPGTVLGLGLYLGLCGEGRPGSLCIRGVKSVANAEVEYVLQVGAFSTPGARALCSQRRSRETEARASPSP